MKILHIITRLILGGAQENTILSCEGSADEGHEVILAHGPIYGPEGSLADRATAAQYQTVEIPSLVRAIHPVKDYLAYRQIRKLIRETRPDVIHTHSSKAGILGRAAAWAELEKRNGGHAVIHTIHGLPFHPYQSSAIRRLYIALERYAARRCHRIACVADAMRDQALAAGIGQRDQYLTIRSGMEVNHYLHPPVDRSSQRAELGFQEDDIVIGTVARLAELKGHDDLIESLASVLADRPEIKLLWVGDGWLRAELEQKIAERRLTGNITITGLVPPQRVAEMMQAMDILAHPSYREGLARTLPQALLCTVPVVSYDCDGAGEVCIDGQTGKLVKTGDKNALRDAILWMVDHESERKQMAERGRERCTRQFDHQRMVQQLHELYRDTLDAIR